MVHIFGGFRDEIVEIYGFEVEGSGFWNEVFGFGILIWELEFRFGDFGGLSLSLGDMLGSHADCENPKPQTLNP